MLRLRDGAKTCLARGGMSRQVFTSDIVNDYLHGVELLKDGLGLLG